MNKRDWKQMIKDIDTKNKYIDTKNKIYWYKE
jgi:hypothetical protein